VAARIAVCPYEAMRKDAATKIGAEFLLDVPGQWCFVRLAGMREKCLEVVAHDAIQHRLCRAAGLIGGGQPWHAAATIAGGMPRLG
jgi:hypothetical protein